MMPLWGKLNWLPLIQGVAGLIVFIVLAWLLSENRRRIDLKLILIGLVLQLLLGGLLLKLPLFRRLFLMLNQIVLALESATRAGTAFVFGYLGGGPLPFEETAAGSSFILAIRALPLVLMVSALSALLFYWRVLPWVVQGFSWCLRKTMRIGGAEGLGVSVNVFVGMVEAPLFVRPYLPYMTRSELFTLMTCGMATIAGTVMVLYASILGDLLPDVLGHILTASIMSVPASILISKTMVPETGEMTTGGMMDPEPAAGAMDAITKGTIRGVQLLINIIAMLIVMVGLVHLVNVVMGVMPGVGGEPLTLQKIFGWAFAPIVWLMGIPWHEAAAAGSLMGTKTIINELIAFMDMRRLSEGVLSQRTQLIMTYAMCGFANPGSLGIMIGGLGTMVPDRRDEIVALGFRSIIAGTLATSMTGAVVGLIAG